MKPFRSRRVQGLPAVLLTLMLAAPVHAQFFVSSGANSTSPVNLFPIDTSSPTFDFTGNTLFIGNSAAGSFSALTGSLLTGGALSIANGGTGSGTVTITGAGTTAQLGGTTNRLEVGNWGVGSLTVSAGAKIDATVNAAACSGAGAFCNNFIGNGAGSTGTLTVTGTGSEVNALRFFGVGQAAVFTTAINGFDFGTPGATTNAFVNVLAGGTLRTQQVVVGAGPSNAAALGTERAIGTVVIDGPGSRWLVGPNTIDNTGAIFAAGSRTGGQATIDIRNGGKLIVDGTGGSGPFDVVNLGNNGGRADMTVSGIGSSVEVKGSNALIQVGRAGAGGQASFSVLAGATASAMFLNVGREGASGTLVIDGAGSQLSLVGVGQPGVTGPAFANIGRDTSTGQATVSNGGRLFISDGGADSRPDGTSPGINVGRDAGSNGRLTITGPDSSVQIVSSTLSPAVGTADNLNPFMSVGRFGGSTGELVVDNGARLLLQGNSVSTLADRRGTSLHIGGTADTVTSGNGKALVSGAGSEIRVSGSDAFIGVGEGAGGVGVLKIANGGRVEATIMNVGRAGGNGALTLDGGTLSLSGQYTSDPFGAALTIGNRGGTGVATLTNGSRIDITNLGPLGASLNLGGTGPNPLGHGTLSIAGGSQINVIAASGLATFTVGGDGSGVATIKESSSVNIGDGSTFIGRLAGSNGTLIVESGSSLTAGYVGVGRTPTGDGGTGRLIVGNNSTVTTTTMEVGTAGFLGGNNGTINGNLILHGTLSPGESPGRLIVNGSFKTGSGHLILDVASNGDGFDVDHLVFTLGTTFSFTGLEVTFNFLGNTDPNAFASAGGFDLDNFLQSLDPATGTVSALSSVFGPGETYDELFATAQFDAASDVYNIQDFRFSPEAGASFSTAPIPEPGTWAMLCMGLAAVGWVGRRRVGTRFVSTLSGCGLRAPR